MLLAAIVVLFSMALMFLYYENRAAAHEEIVLRRFQSINPAVQMARMSASLRYTISDSFWLQQLAWVGALVEPRSQTLRQRVAGRMVRAGFLNPSAPRIFYGSKLVGTSGIFGVCLFFALLQDGDLTPMQFAFILWSCGLGFFAPDLWVKWKIRYREQKVREGLPEALDILLICVGSGATLTSGFQKVGSEFESVNHVISDEFKMVFWELQAGMSKSDALRNLANRVQIEELNSLVTLLVQSEALGASLSKTLRIYSMEMKRKRLAESEERANKLPVKMSLVSTLVFLPALIIFLLSPTIVRLLAALG